MALAATGLLVLAVAVWRLTRPATDGPPAQHLAGTEHYLPGVAADLYLPARSAAAPVVVLVPGGGWQTADRAGLAPLADTLAGDGMVVVNATYRAAADGVRFPTPVQDIVCAADFAVARARAAGIAPGPVILVGHSSGAHLAALAALAGRQLGGRCPDPATSVDGLVGLAGAYDVAALSDLAQPLIGASPEERPDLWHQADPATWVGERLRPCPLAVLLAHGDSDDQVPVSFTTAFARQLARAGHPVRVVVVPGATHQTVYQPGVIATTIRDWVRAQPATCSGATASP